MVNAYDSSFNGVNDAFVSGIDTTLSGSSSLTYSTYLGGTATDVGWAVATGSSGKIYVSGRTEDNTFPTGVDQSSE